MDAPDQRAADLALGPRPLPEGTGADGSWSRSSTPLTARRDLRYRLSDAFPALLVPLRLPLTRRACGPGSIRRPLRRGDCPGPRRSRRTGLRAPRRRWVRRNLGARATTVGPWRGRSLDRLRAAGAAWQRGDRRRRSVAIAGQRGGERKWTGQRMTAKVLDDLERFELPALRQARAALCRGGPRRSCSSPRAASAGPGRPGGEPRRRCAWSSWTSWWPRSRDRDLGSSLRIFRGSTPIVRYSYSGLSGSARDHANLSRSDHRNSQGRVVQLDQAQVVALGGRARRPSAEPRGRRGRALFLHHQRRRPRPISRSHAGRSSKARRGEL